MAGLKYSRQREAVLVYLRSTKSHPTAEQVYQKIREDMRKLNVNDIIANISYAEVAAMVDTYVGEDDFCKKEIPQKVHRVIDELSTYTVFRKADAWERKSASSFCPFAERKFLHIRLKNLNRRRVFGISFW